MKRSLVAGACAAVLMFVASAVPSVAGQIDGAGVSLSWVDANMTGPVNGEGCRSYRFKATNLAAEPLQFIAVEMTSSLGYTVQGSNSPGYDGLRTGESLYVVVRGCTRDGFTEGTPVTFQARVSSKGGTRGNMSGSFAIGPSPRQRMVVVTTFPCDNPEWPSTQSKYCANDKVILITSPALWIGGTDNQAFYVYNKTGAVKSEDVTIAAAAANWNVLSNSLVLRPNKRQFKKGDYLVVAVGGEDPSWKCTFRTDSNPNKVTSTCRWDSGFTDVTGYKFTWNGSEATNVRKAKPSELRSLKLK